MLRRPQKTGIPAAFSSARQVQGFGLLVVAFLLLPVLLGAFDVPTTEQLWRSIDTESGAIAYIHRQVFEETEDLDAVFVGASLLRAAVDTRAVKQELSRRLGREAKVITLAVNWRNEDRMYLLVSELLKRRSVGTLVATMLKPVHADRWPGVSHEIARWVAPGDPTEDFNRGLPLADRASVYASQVLGGLRDVLFWLRPGRLGPSPHTAMLGAEIVDRGFTPNGPGDPERFRRFRPTPPSLPAREMIHWSPGEGPLQITRRSYSDYQRHFVERTLRLIAERDVPLVVLHLPGLPEREEAVLEQLTDWSALAGKPVPVVGVPPRTLFAGLSEEEVTRFYFNKHHMNSNGSAFFTAAVLPALAEVIVRAQ